MSRVALVTGAARGQGAAIVARLRADGFAVAAADLLEIDTEDPDVLAVDLDVSSPPEWSAAVARASRSRRKRARRSSWAGPIASSAPT